MKYMQLTFLDIDSTVAKPKATIHITGKLGLSKEAEKLMQLTDTRYFRLAVDGSVENSKNLYLVESTAEEKGSVKVSKAGAYFYLNTPAVFDKLNINYTDYKIMYDIIKGDYQGKSMFILKRRKKDIIRKNDEKEAAE
jgi:hypothetical protein